MKSNQFAEILKRYEEFHGVVRFNRLICALIIQVFCYTMCLATSMKLRCMSAAFDLLCALEFVAIVGRFNVI